MKSHCGDKTILRPLYLHNGISYTGKMTSLYWNSALEFRLSSTNPSIYFLFQVRSSSPMFSCWSWLAYRSSSWSSAWDSLPHWDLYHIGKLTHSSKVSHTIHGWANGLVQNWRQANVGANYLNPGYGVAIGCHQVRSLYWGYLNLLQRQTSFKLM